MLMCSLRATECPLETGKRKGTYNNITRPSISISNLKEVHIGVFHGKQGF